MPDYHPPYDSPIEDMFAWSLAKYMNPDLALHTQVEIDTFAGRFRLDFLATSPNCKIGLECDGKEYHRYDRDMFRDSIILGATSIDAIYRFGGAAIHYSLDDALYTLSTVEPGLFSPRGRTNLKQLATRDPYIYDGTEFIIRFSTRDTPSIWIRALRRDHPNPVWKRLFAYAEAHSTLSLDAMIQKSDEEGLKWFTD